MKILVIEDEQALYESILAYFTGEGNIVLIIFGL